jgi:hypothetical protein
MSENVEAQGGPFFVVTETVISQHPMAEGLELPLFAGPALPDSSHEELTRRPYTPEELERFLEYTGWQVANYKELPILTPDEAEQKAKRRAMRDSMWGAGAAGVIIDVLGAGELLFDSNRIAKLGGALFLMAGTWTIKLARNSGCENGEKAGQQAHREAEHEQQERQKILDVHHAAQEQLERTAELSQD